MQRSMRVEKMTVRKIGEGVNDGERLLDSRGFVLIIKRERGSEKEKR